jgi:membrane protein YqaA with SNARE-associated domain
VAWGPHGLLLLAVADSAGVPIVGGVDALLIAVAINTPRLAYISAVCAIFGSLIGSLILYVIARKGGEVLLAKHISGRTGKRLHRWFERYGLITVFIPALSPLPLPMKVPVFCSGALGVRWTWFVTVVAAARTIRYFALAYLALHYGHQTFQYLRAHVIALTAWAAGLAVLAIIALQIAARRDAAHSKPAIMNE